MKRLLLILLTVLGLAYIAQAQNTIFVPTCSGTNDTAKLSALITSIGSNDGTIRLPYKTGSARCAVNTLSIPANITLDNTDGSGVWINDGQTLTVAAPPVNPRGKILFRNATAGHGTVSFTGNPIKEVRPEWWLKNTTPGATDMITGITAALESLKTSGGSIFISSPHYISAPIILSKTDSSTNYDNITFRGSGNKTSRIVLPAPALPSTIAEAILAQSTSATPLRGIRVEGIYFDLGCDTQTGSVAGGTTHKGIVFENVTDGAIINNTITRAGSTAISVGRYASDDTKQSNNVDISGNILNDCYGDGISGVGLTNVQVVKNRTKNTGVLVSTSAIGFEVISNSTITANILDTGVYGIVINNASGTVQARVTVTGNSVKNMKSFGGAILNSFGVTMSVNSFHNCSINDSVACVIIDNPFNTAYPLDIPARATAALARNIVSNNVIDKCYGPGIYVGTNGNTISGNNINNANVAAVAGVGGIYVAGTTANHNTTLPTPTMYNLITQNVVQNVIFNMAGETNGACDYTVVLAANTAANFVKDNLGLYMSATTAAVSGYVNDLSGKNIVDDKLIRSTASIPTVGTGEDTLGTVTMYAPYGVFIGPGLLVQTYHGIRIHAAGTKTGSAGNKTIKFYFGSNVITLHPAANTTTSWSADIEILFTSELAQRAKYVAYDGVTISAQGYVAVAELLSSDLPIVIKLTGECANGGDTITQTMYEVEIIK